WHEFREGVFDLTGRTHPERDLAGFIDLAQKHNLFVTVKPGPYVMAETTDQGIPQWLVDTYPETMAVDEHGNPWGPAFVSSVNPVFRQKAARWLDLFARKIVVPRQGRKAGAVIMMQLCNEIGIFQWLGARGEYSKSNIDCWHRYLRSQYPDIRKLSALLGHPTTPPEPEAPLFQRAVQAAPAVDHAYASHDAIAPPTGPCDSPAAAVLYRLWHDYHRWMYGDYVHFIRKTLRGAGVKCPLFTNVGGWVYGRAHEFVMNGTFHRESAKRNPDVLYGLDHIPELVSQLNAHDGIVANQIAEELQGGRGPLYSAELQCGSREHGVQTYPDELGLFWRLCIIHGLTGMNFYMFAQGRNPRGRGSDGPTFYWYNAVDYKANRLPTYTAVKELGDWLAVNGSPLCATRKPSGTAVAFYPHLYETEFTVPTLQKVSKLDAGKLGLLVDPVDFRNRPLFDGLIRILVKKSLPYSFTDITRRSIANLRTFDTLLLMAADVMDAATQKKIADYVKSGGKLVLFPMAPRFDRDLKPCTILGDALGLKTTGRSVSNRVYMGAMKDIPVAMLPQIVSTKGAKALARDADGNVVGVERKVGKGTVRFFGFYSNYTIEEHPDLWSAMCEFDKLPRNATADNDNLFIEARFGKNEGILFVGNFHRMPMRARVQVKDPRGKGSIDIGEIEVPVLNGLMLPVQASLGAGLDLVFAHGELIARPSTSLRAGKGASFTLRGPKGAKGVAVLRSRKPVKSVRIDGKPAVFTKQRDQVRVDYIQTGDAQRIEVK
ncbi:MAG TPA: beta-galactosidase, partial [Kiritimatiellia bacterium]